jgi:hypothetical protein
MNASTTTADIAQTQRCISSLHGREIPDGWEAIVRQLVSTLRFGVVQITVRESHVVQVERTEKVRFAQPASHKSNR